MPCCILGLNIHTPIKFICDLRKVWSNINGNSPFVIDSTTLWVQPLVHCNNEISCPQYLHSLFLKSLSFTHMIAFDLISGLDSILTWNSFSWGSCDLRLLKRPRRLPEEREMRGRHGISSGRGRVWKAHIFGGCLLCGFFFSVIRYVWGQILHINIW